MDKWQYNKSMGNSIMIYKVNGYNTQPTYFDEATNLNAKTDAEAFLAQKQIDVLAYEAVRFSICATFINGNDTTWREIQDSDPEDTICQVFDTFTGSYTQVNSKTEAYQLNEQKKQNFLLSVGLDKVYETDINGSIPVEVM